MKKIKFPILAVLFALVAIQAQAQEERHGEIVTFKAAIPSGGYNCGTSPYYCYGVPYQSNGVGMKQGHFWSDVQGSRGFIAGLGSANWDLGLINITSTKFSHDAQGFLSGIDFTFDGVTTDGDNDTYEGKGHFSFTHGAVMRYGLHYYYMQPGSGFTLKYN